MVKSKKQEIIKKLSTTNKNETEYSKDMRRGTWDTGGEKNLENTWSKGLGDGCCCVKSPELLARSFCIMPWFVGKCEVQMLPEMSCAGASSSCVQL